MLLLLAAAVGASPVVVDVHDGDTITVRLNGERVRVRLHGIDAPELAQAGGVEARDPLRFLLARGALVLEPHGEDRYGRMLAVLYVRGRSVNLQLVRDGRAWWFRRYAPSDSALRRAEEEARAARRGLWAQPSPVAPWEWRQGRRSSPVGKLARKREVSGVASLPQAYVSPEQYLTRERQAERKSEYFDGAILAMAGASIHHNIIVANVIVTIGSQLRGSTCRVFPSDLKVRVGTTRFFYPDVSVICGSPQFHDDVTDVALNPKVLIEVLSDSTTAFDRGAKFLSYQQIPTLQDYLLVSQDAALIERFQRHPAEAWLYSKAVGLSASLELASIAARLPLAEVYDGVEGL